VRAPAPTQLTSQDACVVSSLSNPALARDGIRQLAFMPFDPVAKRTEMTYIEEATGRVRRATKGMTGVIADLCSRGAETRNLERQLENDVEEFARRGLRALAVAVEDVPSGEVDGQGTGFELIGLLSIYECVRRADARADPAARRARTPSRRSTTPRPSACASRW